MLPPRGLRLGASTFCLQHPRHNLLENLALRYLPESQTARRSQLPIVRAPSASLVALRCVMAPPSAGSYGSTVSSNLATMSSIGSTPSDMSNQVSSASTSRSLTLMNPGGPLDRQSKGKSKAPSPDLDLEVVKWEGRTVFIHDRRALASDASSHATPERSISHHVKHQGSSASPISISSSSPSPNGKPRLKAVAAYQGALPRTAFTPPRGLTYFSSARASSHTKPTIGTFEFRTSPSPSPKALPITQRTIEPKPIHPFFTSSRKAPKMNAPRYVATYSSTSQSDSQSTAKCQSTMESQPNETDEVEEEVEEKESPEELNEILGVFKNLDLNKSNPSSSKAAALSKAPLPLAPPPPTRWADLGTLPLFSHRKHSNPPKFAFTSSATEANDLLACLSGPVLGFDMEWPMSGVHRVRDHDGKVRKERHGMSWDTTKGAWKFREAKTALIQICDERMIILIQLSGMKELPSKLVEILQDPEFYLAGVQSNGDGLKLSRDFPAHFQSIGITSLLELSRMARKFDPEGTRGHKAPLISLANLTKGYLGCELDKDPQVRKGNWSTGLTFKQLEYAANDVYASLQLYLHFKRLASQQNVPLDLASFSSKIISHDSNLKSVPPSAAASSSNMGMSQKAANGAGPAAFRALQQFQEGRSIAQIAEAGGIKGSTVQSYIYKAIEALPSHPISDEDKVRLEKDIPMEAYWGGPLRKLLRKRAQASSAPPEKVEEVEQELVVRHNM